MGATVPFQPSSATIIGLSFVFPALNQPCHLSMRLPSLPS